MRRTVTLRPPPLRAAARLLPVERRRRRRTKCAWDRSSARCGSLIRAGPTHALTLHGTCKWVRRVDFRLSMSCCHLVCRRRRSRVVQSMQANRAMALTPAQTVPAPALAAIATSRRRLTRARRTGGACGMSLGGAPVYSVLHAIQCNTRDQRSCSTKYTGGTDAKHLCACAASMRH